LYAALIERLRERGIHAVIGGILLPNDASIVLHERLGFEKVAHFKEVGWKQSQWIDVGYWQLLV
jgi:phosphinothricin acetyltransferase